MPETNEGKRITGEVRIENREGEVLQNVDAPIGEDTYVGGVNGGLMIESKSKDVPKIQGKGNIFVLDPEGNPVRTRRMKLGDKIKVVMSGDPKGLNFDEVGEISY